MIKTTAQVEGMMCEHCEATVNEAIQAAFSVESVGSSHAAGKTEIVAEEALSQEELAAALADTKFKVVAVSSEPYQKTGLFG